MSDIAMFHQQSLSPPENDPSARFDAIMPAAPVRLPSARVMPSTERTMYPRTFPKSRRFRIPQSQAVRSSLTNDHGGLSSGWRRSTQPHSVLFGTEQLGLVPATAGPSRLAVVRRRASRGSPVSERNWVYDWRRPGTLPVISRDYAMPPGELCPFARRTFRKRI